MLRISLQTLRSRRGALTGAFVAILLAVCFAYASGLLMSGALQSPGAGRLAGADLVVRADPTVRPGTDLAEDVIPGPPLDAALVARAAAVPGVARAVPDTTFAVGVRDARGPVATPGAGHIQGHPWSAAALTPY